MPSVDEIITSLSGAWRMMNGRTEGLRMLDLSADGFWTSFFAIVIALPALFLGWVSVANDIVAFDPEGAGRLSLILRLALVDLAAWLLPLVGLALIARHVGIGDRYVHYVVASNWATAIIVWIMLPPALLHLFLPDEVDGVSLLSLLLFLATMFLSWRLTNVAIGKGPAVATGVFAAMVAASLFVLFGMQDLIGLDRPSG
ncbi:transporter [Aquibium sp. LZ166]|uniref:Transporter n=1 Tax=Aquibium pacificus TaxID=3153579 RepID=A0ABV3SLM4_9HYPH